MPGQPPGPGVRMPRAVISRAVILSLIGMLLAATGYWYFFMRQAALAPIKVGILHSRSGPMAISESSMVDGEMLAIEEINAKGGLLGHRIEAVIADGKSDPTTFANEAERLITQDKVAVIFGCWTSASRKTVKTVIEKHNQLLVYPMAYEGIEQSPNIIYTGAAPNQLVIPAADWSLQQLGTRIFLLGSDYVWPHAINAMMRDAIVAAKGEVVGEEYVFFGSSDVTHAIEQIKKAKPEVILSSVVGDSNIALYKALSEAGLAPEMLPVVSFSIGEEELRTLPIDEVAGHYSAWSYFQSMQTPENEAFVRKFRARYGAERVTSDVIEASYFSVMLWAKAVTEAGTFDVGRVRKSMSGQSLRTPEGLVSIDTSTQHAWRSFSIGRVRNDRQFEVIWNSSKPIRPTPYPLSRSRSEWDAFLADLYTKWGGSWSNPVKAN